MWNYEEPRIVNTNLRKYNSVGGLTLLDINTQYIYKTVVIREV